MKTEAVLTVALLGFLAAPAASQDAEALYREACGGGDATACSVLALMFETGQGMPRDLARASALYGQACDLGDMEGCTILASMYGSGQGVERDMARAVSLHERACDGEEFTGCENLGLLYETGAGVLVDYPHSADLYGTACDGGLASACNRLGMMLQNGLGQPSNPEGALEYFAQACDGGETSGCVNLGVGYERGDGIEQDPSMALMLYEYSCDVGDLLGCVNLGSLHRTGTGVPQDQRRAASLYRRACDGGQPLGCFNLGTSYELGEGVPQDVVTAVASFQRACVAGLRIGCEKLPTATRAESEPVDSSVVATFGRVADGETEQGIADAIVDLPDLGIRLRSDRTGRVDLPDLPVGRHLIRAEASGYAVTEGILRVPGEADFLVMLEHALVSDPNAAGQIVGRVTDQDRDVGLGDVDINIVNRLSGRTISNQQGRFALQRITPGLVELRFERLGYEPRVEYVIVQPGMTIDILAALSTRPIPLEPIRVVAVRSPYLERNGFYERSARAWGVQFGPAEITALMPESLTELIFRVPAVEVEGGRNVGSPATVVSRRRTGATEAACR
ncbi:MAG: carboxypeptidase regulatory-like domain-containing protein, partial [Gemmatimonadota bacterium]|nr:carboxypeptidase regulatory-like domain-containing protein [Gemmatimonadota bacterium]